VKWETNIDENILLTQSPYESFMISFV